jgi:hypothetical protein
MAQVLVVDRKGFLVATRQTVRQRRRPLTASQERLFFGVAFGLAFLIQIAAVWAPLLGAH